MKSLIFNIFTTIKLIGSIIITRNQVALQQEVDRIYEIVILTPSFFKLFIKV